MLKPIPMKVLIDSAVHSTLITGTRGRTYSPATSLTNVLIQNVKNRTIVDGNLITTSDATLFFDVANSSGDATFKIGDKIAYTDGFGNAQEKYVKKIVEAKTNEGIHHYELMLL